MFTGGSELNVGVYTLEKGMLCDLEKRHVVEELLLLNAASIESSLRKALRALCLVCGIPVAERTRKGCTALSEALLQVDACAAARRGTIMTLMLARDDRKVTHELRLLMWSARLAERLAKASLALLHLSS